MSKAHKFLVCVTEEVTVKKVKDVYFLFPLKNFCVGFTKEYTIEEIKDEAYIYINRMLNTKDIENLKPIISHLPNNIKGIVFEDLGVYELCKNLKIEKILYALHANCNSKTINTYLEKMDSVVISPDITYEQTKEILLKARKPLVIYGLGHLNFMYSRRPLLTNYANYYHYPVLRQLDILEEVSKTPFIVMENDYGTVFYDKYIYNASILKDLDNIKFVLINPLKTNLDTKDAIEAFLNGNDNDYTTGFLHQKTIYKVKKKGE